MSTNETAQNAVHETRSGRHILGLALGALLVVGAIVTTIFSLVDHDSNTSSHQTGIAARTDLCGQAPGEYDVNTLLPASIETLASGVKIAHQDGIGPCVREGVPHGYAPSDAGALFAAANFSALYSAAGPSTVDVLETLAVDNETNRELIAIFTADPPAQVTQQVLEGFTLTRLDEDTVRVRLAVRLSGRANVAAWTITMHWQDGDWKAEYTSAGEYVIEQIDALSKDGFTAWGF